MVTHALLDVVQIQ